jgi:hypothetical protein
MSKILKKLEKWKNCKQPVPKGQVLAVVERYFPGNYDLKEGSHIVVRHPKLQGIEGYGPYGEITIVIKSGQTVMPVYLKRLVATIEYLSGIDAIEKQEESDE